MLHEPFYASCEVGSGTVQHDLFALRVERGPCISNHSSQEHDTPPAQLVVPRGTSMTMSAHSTKRQTAKKARSERTRKAQQTAFLSAFRRTVSVTSAAKEAGVSRSTHYNWIDTDPEYAEQVEAVNEELADALEQEAHRRAVEGVEEPVFCRGERVGSIRKYSDPLLILLLKAKRPEQFRDSVDVTNKLDDGTTVIDPAVMKTLTDEDIRVARLLGRKLAGLESSRKVEL